MEMTQNYTPYQGFFKRLTGVDCLYAVALFIASIFALSRYGSHMAVYVKGCLILASPSFAWQAVH